LYAAGETSEVKVLASLNHPNIGGALSVKEAHRFETVEDSFVA
jgi:hypothetical protein